MIDSFRRLAQELVRDATRMQDRLMQEEGALRSDLLDSCEAKIRRMKDLLRVKVEYDDRKKPAKTEVLP